MAYFTFNGACFRIGRLSLHSIIFFPFWPFPNLLPAKRNEKNKFYLDQWGRFPTQFLNRMLTVTPSMVDQHSWQHMPCKVSEDIGFCVSRRTRLSNTLPCLVHLGITWRIDHSFQLLELFSPIARELPLAAGSLQASSFSFASLSPSPCHRRSSTKSYRPRTPRID